MNSKLKISAAILLVFVSVVGLKAQFGPVGGAPGGAPTVYDPATGAPVVTAVPEWKDAKWKDPEITLTNVFYDNIPLSEVAKSLSEQFKQQFDVLLPAFRDGWQTDWQSEPINLRLKNVTASEIFSAMNLVFENNRTPLRWELKLNGHRQIALLRVLVDPVPQGNTMGGAPAPEMLRRVYFVGNLIGAEKDGGMTMEQIVKTLTEVWHMGNPAGGDIQFHKDAQLLVVTAGPGQIDFMEQTLKALAQKRERAKDNTELPSESKSVDNKSKSNESKPAAAGR